MSQPPHHPKDDVERQALEALAKVADTFPELAKYADLNATGSDAYRPLLARVKALQGGGAVLELVLDGPTLANLNDLAEKYGSREAVVAAALAKMIDD